MAERAGEILEVRDGGEREGGAKKVGEEENIVKRRRLLFLFVVPNPI